MNFNRLFSMGLFCKHIFKTENSEKLRTTREPNYGPGITTYSDYQYYAHYQECVKCGRKKIVESRVIIL
jgi:hypothetical protein